MKMSEFRLLSLSQQASTVETCGVQLGSRKRDKFQIKLFQVDDFYIEVYIHQYNNQIVGFSSFTDTDELEPYLNDMDISGLMQPL